MQKSSEQRSLQKSGKKHFVGKMIHRVTCHHTPLHTQYFSRAALPWKLPSIGSAGGHWYLDTVYSVIIQYYTIHSNRTVKLHCRSFTVYNLNDYCTHILTLGLRLLALYRQAQTLTSNEDRVAKLLKQDRIHHHAFKQGRDTGEIKPTLSSHGTKSQRRSNIERRTLLTPKSKWLLLFELPCHHDAVLNWSN